MPQCRQPPDCGRLVPALPHRRCPRLSSRTPTLTPGRSPAKQPIHHVLHYTPLNANQRTPLNTCEKYSGSSCNGASANALSVGKGSSKQSSRTAKIPKVCMLCSYNTQIQSLVCPLCRLYCILSYIIVSFNNLFQFISKYYTIYISYSFTARLGTCAWLSGGMGSSPSSSSSLKIDISSSLSSKPATRHTSPATMTFLVFRV